MESENVCMLGKKEKKKNTLKANRRNNRHSAIHFNF